MVDYVNIELFNSGSAYKQWIFDGDTHRLTNEDIVIESLSLYERMCESETFEFGTYSASTLKVKVRNTSDRFVGEMFTVWVYLNDDSNNPLKIGYYFVKSDKIAGDRRSRELIMYDPLYNLPYIDATDFFNTFMQRTSGTTMKFFRDSFFSFLAVSNEFGYAFTQEETTLANDNIDIKFNSEIGHISASDILKAILHFNGCNGIITRSGSFRYIYLPKTSGIVVNREIENQNYYRCDYEEYTVESDGVIVRQTETKENATVDGSNSPIFEGNIFFFEKSVEDLSVIADNLANKLNDTINFTPFTCSVKGNPCYECGDVIEIETDRDIFTSIIVSRTLTGTQGLVDNYATYCAEKFNRAYNVGMISDTQFGYIGNSSIDTEDGETILNYARTAWKLRSAAVNKNEERYYTYMTANKNLISTNSEKGKHTALNDRTDKCSIGSYKYPWGKGYFNLLRVQHHNVLPEGLRVTLLGGSNNWTAYTSANGYKQEHTINGMTGDIYLYIATETASSLEAVYKYNIEVDTIETNKVTFVANAIPPDDISVILLVEDFIYSNIEEPILVADFDQELNQLSCNWSSPRDSSKFITWLKDELVIERCIDEEHPDDPTSWEQVLVVPASGETPFEPDQFEDTPLVVGSEDE